MVWLPTWGSHRRRCRGPFIHGAHGESFTLETLSQVFNLSCRRYTYQLSPYDQAVHIGWDGSAGLQRDHCLAVHRVCQPISRWGYSHAIVDFVDVLLAYRIFDEYFVFRFQLTQLVEDVGNLGLRETYTVADDGGV